MTDAGIAIAGMWIAVAVVGYKSPGAGFLLGFFAIIGTMAVMGVK